LEEYGELDDNAITDNHGQSGGDDLLEVEIQMSFTVNNAFIALIIELL
jgi:hypothetical protein